MFYFKGSLCGVGHSYHYNSFLRRPLSTLGTHWETLNRERDAFWTRTKFTFHICVHSHFSWKQTSTKMEKKGVRITEFVWRSVIVNQRKLLNRSCGVHSTLNRQILFLLFISLFILVALLVNPKSDRPLISPYNINPWVKY